MSPLEGVVAARSGHDVAEACGMTEAWRGGTTREPAQGHALVALHWTKQRRQCA